MRYNLWHFHSSDSGPHILQQVENKKAARKLLTQACKTRIETSLTLATKLSVTETNITLRFGHPETTTWTESYWISPDEGETPVDQQVENYKALATRFLHLRNEEENLKPLDRTPEITRELRNLRKKLDRLSSKLLQSEPAGFTPELLSGIWAELEDSIPND